MKKSLTVNLGIKNEKRQNIEMGKEEFRKVNQGLNLGKRGELKVNRKRVGGKEGKGQRRGKKSSN